MPRSTICAARDRARQPTPLQPRKRGPKTALCDEDVVVQIRDVLKTDEFLGEGHRKVRARLRARGIRVGKNRVLRLMRENGVLAPVRRGKHARGDRSHSGRITTDMPDELWGTDATRFHTKDDGWCWFFMAVDHCVTDVVGGTWPRRETGGRLWSPSDKACGPISPATPPGSLSALDSGTTGAPSTRPTSSRPS